MGQLIYGIVIMSFSTWMYFWFERQDPPPPGYMTCHATLLPRATSDPAERWRYEFVVDGTRFEAETEAPVQTPKVHYNPAAPGSESVVVQSHINFGLGLVAMWVLVLGISFARLF